MPTAICFTNIVDIPKPFGLSHLIEAFTKTLAAKPELPIKHALIFGVYENGTCFIAESEESHTAVHAGLRGWLADFAVFEQTDVIATDDTHERFIKHMLVQLAVLATKKKIKVTP